MATLRLLRHGGPPLEITQDRVLVGRDPSCDIVLDDKSVSRRHACFERHGDGWGVVDQGSANGTFVNGQQVVQAELRDGQELRLGMVPLRVEIESDAAQTMLMGGPVASSTVLMPNPMSVAPLPHPAPAAPPVALAPPAAAWAPEPAYAPRSPQEEAAAFLGIHPGAPLPDIQARYEELTADLNAKLASAPTPNLQHKYQKNLDEVRRACEALHPGFSTAGVADLPTAQPSVIPDEMDISIPAPVRAAISAPSETAPARSGAPATSTTVISGLVMTSLAVCAFFSLSKGKMEKAYNTTEKSTPVVQGRLDAKKFKPVEQLVSDGALKNGALKICNKGSHPLEVMWLGAVYTDMRDPNQPPSDRKVRSYNSDFCRQEGFKIKIAPGSEEAPQFKGSDRCTWDGQGLFFAMAIRDPKNPENLIRVSGLLHNRQDCVNVGEGW
jgi:pSer/pThr/pTyr-binding forkhead associated (FHA) protein